jgi:hypothetical protein
MKPQLRRESGPIPVDKPLVVIQRRLDAVNIGIPRECLLRSVEFIKLSEWCLTTAETNSDGVPF